MNWGYKILFVYALFVAGIMLMVFKSSNQKMDLVTSDYYTKELKYQQHIDELNRTQQLKGQVECKVEANKVVVVFPADFSGKKLTGGIEFYCPSDKDKDINRSFSIQDAPLELSLPEGYRGTFDIHLNWEAEGLHYYFEKKLFL